MNELFNKINKFLDKLDDKIYKLFPLAIDGRIFKRLKDKDNCSDYGIILFRDGVTNKIEFGRSVKLKEYLDSINSSSIKSGRYGRGPRDMQNVEVFFIEVDSKEEVVKLYNHFNKFHFKYH